MIEVNCGTLIINKNEASNAQYKDGRRLYEEFDKQLKETRELHKKKKKKTKKRDKKAPK